MILYSFSPGDGSFPAILSIKIMYSLLCHVHADLSRVPKLPRASTFGKSKYYAANFEVVLSLGLTELKAHICWQENVRVYTMC